MQGMIQLAAAFHHYGHGNFTGTKSLLEAGLDKLRKCPREYRGTNLHMLRRTIDVWLEAMTRGGSTEVSRFPQIEYADQGRWDSGM